MKTSDSLLGPTFVVQGHQFMQCGSEWIDAAITKMPEAPRVRVRFDSREFFELLQRFPKLLRLASGRCKLQLALGGTVYEIDQ